MGWSGGSDLMDRVIAASKIAIGSDLKRKLFYVSVIGAFEDQDADTLDECRGLDPMFDEAMLTLHPKRGEG